MNAYFANFSMRLVFNPADNLTMRLTERPATMPSLLVVDSALDNEIDNATDPLIVEMKNTHRLDRIRTNLRADVTVVFKTSPVSRVMRRDWNLVSAKMFLNAIDERQRKRIATDLTELHWQANDLLDALQALPMPKEDWAWMRPRQIDAQVVHPLAAQWLRCMKTIDECYLILINAEKAKIITRKQRWAMVAPSQLAYLGFKTSAMNLPLKSTTELLEAAGL